MEIKTLYESFKVCLIHSTTIPLQEGLCPDIDQSRNSQDQVEFRGGMKNTYTNTFDVDFRRSIIPNDNYDAPIPLSGSTQVFVFYIRDFTLSSKRHSNGMSKRI